MGAPKTFCITLREEPFRRKAAMERFQRKGFSDISFIDGVSGAKAGLRPSSPCDIDQYGKLIFMHPSAVGCALSHRIALNCAISSRSEEFIILEDDAAVRDDFLTMWPSLREEFPDDAALVQLGYFYHSPQEFERINEFIVRCKRYPYCTVGIWWRRETALQALRVIDPMDRATDVIWIQRLYPFVGHYLCDPPVVWDLTSSGEWETSVQLKNPS